MPRPTFRNLPERKAELERILNDGLFKHAKEIPMNSRLIRDLCSHYPNIFFSTQSGYKLVCFATNEEIGEAIADLRSRIGSLADRANALSEELRHRNQIQMNLQGGQSNIDFPGRYS